MFKVGDRVRCIKGKGHTLMEGRIYRVRATLPVGTGTQMVYVKSDDTSNVHDGWRADRFELVKEQDMPKNYPTDLEVGDVLHTNTGRTYTVVSYDANTGDVSYAYIPWNSKDNTIEIDERNVETLHWVAKVTNRKGYKVWEATRPATVGDMVEYGGRKWEVTHDNKGSLTLRRSVTDVSADKVRVV